MLFKLWRRSLLARSLKERGPDPARALFSCGNKSAVTGIRSCDFGASYRNCKGGALNSVDVSFDAFVDRKVEKRSDEAGLCRSLVTKHTPGGSVEVGGFYEMGDTDEELQSEKR